jgi:hypothetical protein
MDKFKKSFRGKRVRGFRKGKVVREVGVEEG